MGGRAGRAPPRPLRRLAAAAGIETAYTDVFGRSRSASTETLLGALQAMGLAVRRPEDAGSELHRLEAERASQICDPVIVAWDGAGSVRLKGKIGRVRLTARFEDGSEESWNQRGAVGRLPRGLPVGIHALHVIGRGIECSATLLVAPPTCFDPPKRALGVFAPLYALRTQRAWGTADVTDLRGLMEWADHVGADLVGTLPLLACFLEEPFEPSPYAPVSRLFWNPLYADPAAAPELAGAPDVRRLLASEAFRREVAAVREGRHVDYRKAWALKRRVLERLAHVAFGTEAGRRRMRTAAQANPDLGRFAEFVARREDARVDERKRRVHLYAQSLISAQMRSLAARKGSGLYLDLPIGVHGAGFDVWRYGDQFASGASVGAPPDAFFVRGQDWGFPPMHPEGSRRAGHRYFAASVRHHMRHARAVRVDHVMGMHRLYWIPRGLDGKSGAYIRYPAEELYAILCIESHRNSCQVIGENLGTVPPVVNRALKRRRILGMWIGVFEPPTRARRWGRKGALAALGTHDTPTFGGFWAGHDIPLRRSLGHLDAPGAARERRSRDAWRSELWRVLERSGLVVGGPDAAKAHDGILRGLAAGPCPIVLASLEDLWLEADPQNVPGTVDEHVNWRRRMARPLEEIITNVGWNDLLRDLSSRLCSPGGR